MITAYSDELSLKEVDLGWFDTTYHQYHNAVYANIFKMIKQHELAEDILQEVFMTLWQNRQKLDMERIAGWLFVASYNRTLKYLKKKQQLQLVPFEGTVGHSLLIEEPVSEELYSLRLSIVEEAVNHLPERKKEVFRLYRYEGKSFDEVAHIVGISVNSVKDYLKQSNRFIRDYVSENCTELSALAPLLFAIYLR